MTSLKILLSVLLATAGALLFVPSPVLAQTDSNIEKSEPAARVKGTRVSLVKPEGFEQAPTFNGYIFKDMSASVMVTEMPAPIDKILEGFTQENLALKGMTMLSKKDVEVSGHRGVLVEAKQAIFKKWLTVFGSPEETVLVVAAFPEEYSDELSDRLKDCVSSVTWDRSSKVDVMENLNFAVQAKAPFKLARRLQNTLVFTEDGKFPATKPEDPIYIVGESFFQPEISGRKEFCVQRLGQTQGVKDASADSVEPVKYAGLDGYVIAARGKDSRTDDKMYVYQVILFGEKSYFIHVGMVADTQKDKFEPAFKAMSETFALR
ncbi:MAG: hypothetical protein IPM23_11475 [Candidatus Melainabacteria bacterium]|nr:hypothetical protein [Candidatus Melainabacteria bacterium]